MGNYDYYDGKVLKTIIGRSSKCREYYEKNKKYPPFREYVHITDFTDRGVMDLFEKDKMRKELMKIIRDPEEWKKVTTRLDEEEKVVLEIRKQFDRQDAILKSHGKQVQSLFRKKELTFQEALDALTQELDHFEATKVLSEFVGSKLLIKSLLDERKLKMSSELQRY